MVDRELPPGRLSDLRLAWAGSMRRARLRRKIEVLRYRLAVRIGGWHLREAEAERAALRTDIDRLTGWLDGGHGTFSGPTTGDRWSYGYHYAMWEIHSLMATIDGPDDPPVRLPAGDAPDAPTEETETDE